MSACQECACSIVMHFDDGCHTATGFICDCKQTPSSLGVNELADIIAAAQLRATGSPAKEAARAILDSHWLDRRLAEASHDTWGIGSFGGSA